MASVLKPSSPAAKIVSFRFYGYPAEVIARWCLVPLQKARRLKSGQDEPNRWLARLFELHAQEQLLTPEWCGWKIRGGTIVDPQGNVTTENQLRCYALVYQWAADIARRDDALRAQYDNLLRLASNG